jgi:predicted nuclease of restriction endonuclease-like (RecB) superfamily
MSNVFTTDSQYQTFIETLKKQIKSTSQRVVRSLNSELINLYLQIGQQIVEKQATAKWGDSLLKQVEQDLKTEFPNLKGFSQRNLIYMRSLYKFCLEFEISQQLVAKLPWGHLTLIIDKIKNREEALFYINKVIENSWSRVILDHQIDFNLFGRQGQSLNNFDQTVTADTQVQQIKQSFKESYVLDFLELGQVYKEKQLENSLVENVTKFMLELGKGFAYVGRQFKLQVSEQEFYIDLLFYNYILRRFVVVELKTNDFKPEYIGQLNFYMTVIDRQVKQESDESTIGLLICKSKDKTIVEYSLSQVNQPTAVASYELPTEVQQQLPDKEEIISGISKLSNNSQES